MSTLRSPIFDDEMDRDIDQKQRECHTKKPFDQLSQILHSHFPCVEGRNLTLCSHGLYSANWKPARQVVCAVSAANHTGCGKWLT